MRCFCLVLIGLGLGVSGYLLYRSFALLDESSTARLDICAAVFGTGCDETLLDEASWVLGIPLAGWGFVYYATLVSLLAMASALGHAFAPQAMLGALLWTVAGAAVSVGLAASMIAGSAPFCPLCMIVHVVNVALVPLVKRWGGQSLSESYGLLRAGLKYALGRTSNRPVENAWKVVGFVTAALVAVVVYQWVFVEVGLRRIAGQRKAEDVLAAYLAAPRRAIPISDSDPQLGRTDASVQLIVFSDFECPACRRFALRFIELQRRFDKDVLFVFKHFPLSTACNPHLKADLHPDSCRLAWAGQAAHLQGKFWAFHDAAFSAETDLQESSGEEIARRARLDVDRFSVDRQSPAVRNDVRDDIELGSRLGIRGTPAVFVNGRSMSSVTFNSLQTVIQHELQSISHPAVAGEH